MTPPVMAGAAAAVVFGTAILFGLIGLIRGPDLGDSTIAAPTTEVAPTEDDGAETGAAPDDQGDGGGGVAAGGAEGDDSGGGGDTAANGADEAAGSDESAEQTDGGGDAPPAEGSKKAAAQDAREASGSAAPAPQIDPAAVSIQVLDAVGDGGAAAQRVAADLQAAGFDVIVINGASRGYDVTTVFWSDEQGPGGRAVADAIGAGRAERTPPEVRLSDTVDVHVVVGADKA